MLPLDIHILSKNPIDDYLTMDFFYNACLGLKGYKLVDKIFKIYCPIDAQIILDPMCGMGYTAQATVDRGISFRGNELNKKRLDKTIKRLSKSVFQINNAEMSDVQPGLSRTHEGRIEVLLKNDEKDAIKRCIKIS